MDEMGTPGLPDRASQPGHPDQPDEADRSPSASVHVQIPRLRALARHAAPNVVIGMVLPVAVFLAGLAVVGPWGAMTLGLVWAYAVVAAHAWRRRRIPGLVVLGTLTLTARTLIAGLSGSVFVYFLQPTLGTTLVACAFLVSVPLRRPLAERLVRDFVPFPPELLADHRIRRFFTQISLLWAFTQFANAAVTIWLLTTQTLGTFVVARTAVSSTLTLTAIVVSTVWFHRSMARHGILVTRRALLTAPAAGRTPNE